jgi:transposase
LSVSVALAFHWSGRRARLFFQTRPDSYNTPALIAFLQDLKREFRGRRVILVWDGLPAHKSHAMTAFLRTQRAWLSIERLPGYAPELNPVEQLWGNVKGTELANQCADNLKEVAAALRKGMARVRRRRSLAFSFLKHTGLSF